MSTVNDLRAISTPALTMNPTSKIIEAPGFAEHLKGSIMTANVLQKQSENAQLELATGRSGNIHETLIAMNKASVSFEMIKAVRNKVITAYQEIMRMQA